MLYRNGSVVIMEDIRKLNKMKVDAARKDLLKAKSRARDAEMKLKAAQRSLDKAKNIANRNMSRAKADAKKAKMTATPKMATPKRITKAHMSVSGQTRAISKTGSKTERQKSSAGSSTATIVVQAEVKPTNRPKRGGKNGGKKPCEVCGKAIIGRRSQKYCSKKCLYEKNNELGRLRNKNNPEKVKEYRKKWYENNPGKNTGQSMKPANADTPNPSGHPPLRYLITLTYLYYTQYMVTDAANPADAIDIARALVPHDWSTRDTSMLRVYEAPLAAVPTGKWLQTTNTIEMHIEQRTSMCSRKVGL